MSTYTPKTYTAMHYSRFIWPGARRIEARPAFGSVQVGAFVHEENGDVTIVAINPNEQTQRLNLNFRNLTGLTLLKVYRTSASENMQEVGEVEVSDNKAAFEMTPMSIVTFSGKISG
jgi:O-glycosyl hydrolase